MDFMWNYQIKKMYLRYFSWQFIGKGAVLGDDGYIKSNLSLNGLYALPFLIGLIGMIHHFYKHWRHASMVLALFVLTGVAIVIYLNQEDPQPRERDYVFVGSYFAFALWIGAGMAAVLEWVQEAFHDKQKLRNVLAVVLIAAFFVAAPANLLAFNYETHDRTGNYVAYDYSYNILQSCEKDAVIFTNGDNDTFPLWFLQYVYNIRPDVRVVNLSLLNTPWYIKQLKSQEPKVPISIPDNRIDDLELMRWEEKTVTVPVTDAALDRALDEVSRQEEFLESDEYNDKELKFTLKPTLMGQALRVQDYMVLNIIMANRWEKPLYFAVTVSNTNQIGLNDYMRMDGLSFRIVPYNTRSGNEVDPERLERNLFEVFQFRNLNNADVYYNDNIIGLLQNYRAAFMRLINVYQQRGNMEGVERVLRRMEEVIPFDVIPTPQPRMMLYFGQLYEMTGNEDDFLRLAEQAFEQAPDNNYVVGTYVSLLQRYEKYDTAIEVLQVWQEKFPSDNEAQRKIEEIREQMNAPDTVLN